MISLRGLFGKKEVSCENLNIDIMDNLKGKSYLYETMDGKKFIGEYVKKINGDNYYYYIEGCSLIIDKPAKVLRETTLFEDVKLNWIREAHKNNYCIRFISSDELEDLIEEKKIYYVNNDNKSNNGVEYTFLNNTLYEAKYVKTGERKKALEVVKKPIINIQDGIAFGETYTSKFAHGTVQGKLVRVEDTPNFLKVILNTEKNQISLENKLATVI